MKLPPIDAVTDTSSRGRSAMAPFVGRSWTHLALWVAAWSALVPLRMVKMLLNPPRRSGYLGQVFEEMMVSHTSWAVVTFVMFRVALRARQEPLRRVLAMLGLLTVPLIVARFEVTSLVSADRLHISVLWASGVFQFFPLATASALGLLVVYIQRERDNAVFQANLQAELASARLQTLRLQLNPHFLFNALNSIASLVPPGTNKADTAIAALSAFLRASLSVTRGEETTLETELQLVDDYLEIEMLRFEWLVVDLDVADALRSACVPTFVLQLLVENAIRHGLAPRRARGRLHIGARLDGDHLELRVTDDGVGFGARPETAPLGIGLGLQNVRARLAQLHGSDGTLTLVPAAPQGTVAIVRIPYRVCPADPMPTLADA